MYVYIYKKKAEMTNKNYCETNSACVFPICSGGIYSIAWKSHQKVLHLHTHTIFCTYFAIAHKINRTICLAGIYIYIYVYCLGWLMIILSLLLFLFIAAVVTLLILRIVCACVCVHCVLYHFTLPDRALHS